MTARVRAIGAGGGTASRRRVLAAALAAVALAAACSGGGSEGADEAEPAGDDGGSPAGEAPAEPEAFAGTVDEFYEVPDPLPPGEPGDVIRTMPIDAPEGEAGLRIMYRSTDAEGDERAVTGAVYHPTGEPPEGGWPVLAWAHGTSGLAAPCAPSRNPAPPPAFGVQGVRVATDYVGLGPVGELHPYLSAAAEGNAVIDGVAAVRALPDLGAGDRWAVAGVSQGGHAALMTNEMAADRLPDAELVGSVALAPGAELGQTFGDDLQARVITTLVLFGAAAEDPSIDVRDYLAPHVHTAAEGAIERGCIGDVVSSMLPLAGTPDYFTTDPRTEDLGVAWLEENDPGSVASESPLLLAQGGRDVVVVPARTDALFARLCDVGQVVRRVDVPDADHDTITTEAGTDAAAWLADRFAGEPAPDDC